MRKVPCVVCQLTPASEVDHIVPRVFGGTNDESNLADVCRRCHREKPEINSDNPQDFIDSFEFYKSTGGIFLQHYRMGIMDALSRVGKDDLDASVMTFLVQDLRERFQRGFMDDWEHEKEREEGLIKRAEIIAKNHNWSLQYAKSSMKKTRRGQRHPNNCLVCRSA